MLDQKSERQLNNLHSCAFTKRKERNRHGNQRKTGNHVGSCGKEKRDRNANNAVAIKRYQTHQHGTHLASKEARDASELSSSSFGHDTTIASNTTASTCDGDSVATPAVSSAACYSMYSTTNRTVSGCYTICVCANGTCGVCHTRVRARIRTSKPSVVAATS